MKYTKRLLPFPNYSCIWFVQFVVSLGKSKTVKINEKLLCTLVCPLSSSVLFSCLVSLINYNLTVRNNISQRIVCCFCFVFYSTESSKRRGASVLLCYFKRSSARHGVCMCTESRSLLMSLFIFCRQSFNHRCESAAKNCWWCAYCFAKRITLFMLT